MRAALRIAVLLSIFVGAGADPAAAASDLQAKLNGTTTVTRGSAMSLTTTFRNHGPDAMSQPTTLAITFPAGYQPTTGSGSGWNCSASGSTLTCTRANPVTPGTDAPNVTVNANVLDEAAASGVVTASVSNTGDTNAANNAATLTLTALWPRDLAARVNSTSGQADSNVSVGLTVDNRGSSASGGTITLTAKYPSSVSFISVDAFGDWVCALGQEPQTVVCTTDSSKGANSSNYVGNLVLKPSEAAAPSFDVTATVASTGDQDPANDSTTGKINVFVSRPPAQSSTPPSGTSSTSASGTNHALLISSPTTKHTAGKAFTIRFDFKRTGSLGNAPTTATITLPTGLRLVRATGVSWKCTGAPVVTCTTTSRSVFDVRLSVRPVITMTTATVSASFTNADDSNAADNQATATFLLLPAPVRSFQLSRGSRSTASVEVGERFVLVAAGRRTNGFRVSFARSRLARISAKASGGRVRTTLRAKKAGAVKVKVLRRRGSRWVTFATVTVTVTG